MGDIVCMYCKGRLSLHKKDVLLCPMPNGNGYALTSYKECGHSAWAPCPPAGKEKCMSCGEKRSVVKVKVKP